MTESLAGACYLITGGTGSFGTAMARRLLAVGSGEVRVFSRDEAKQDAMRRRFDDGRLRFYLGDVRDQDTLERACQGVDYVFHAAALKQVPSCEFFPLEAVRTNVFGSVNVVEAARAVGVRMVVCLSTDKAVYPMNAMGMSKALMEKLAQAYARTRPPGDPVVCTVRYGNVLCSRGSVVPLFIEQLSSGRPLTVTEPGMTRFLMSVDDAVGLVEQAFRVAEPGDLFVRKAPASTVGVLARAVARLYGVPPELNVIGMRHGEKLHETLVTREEMARAEDWGEFFRIPVEGDGLDYSRYVEAGDPNASASREYASHNAERLDEEAVMKVLLQTSEIRAWLPQGGNRELGPAVAAGL
jgi:UDP-glucose 4-epimerase